MTAPFVALVLIAGVVLWWRGHDAAAVWMPAALVAWLGGFAAWSWWRRPGAFPALAAWDEAAGRNDMFASAHGFLQQDREPGPGETLHIRKAMAAWDAGAAGLSRDLPFPAGRWKALLPLAVMAVLFVPRPQPPPVPGEGALPREALGMAAGETMRLVKKHWEEERLEGLDEKEQGLARALEQKLRVTAGTMAGSQGMSAGEALRKLEAAAREAEELAEKLGEGDESWASSGMTAEMRRHADLANLGEALEARQASAGAGEALGLAERLSEAKPAPDTVERLAEAVRRSAEAGDAGDEGRLAGARIKGAERSFRAVDIRGAGGQFFELAEALKNRAAREESRDRLEKLADQLREAGNRAAGSESMKQLAGANDAASGGGGSGAGAGQGGSGEWQGGEVPGSLAQALQRQMEGLANGVVLQAPVPGTEPMEGQVAEGQAFVPGEGKPGGDGTLFAAPVPGQDPDAEPEGLLLLQGVARAGTNSGAPGAGSGQAPLGEEPGTTAPATQSSVVAGTASEGGSSASRLVEGGVRPETAERGATGAAARFEKAGEAAMDDDALPLSRREAVRRYFEALRNIQTP
jgi:hypothetical protein